MDQEQLKLAPSKINVTRPQAAVKPPVIAEEEPQKLTPDVQPTRVPIWRDANGNLSYDMPDNYNWFSSFADRRLYAQTGGGAGYWLGGRTPTRMFYEWSIGDFQGSEKDEKWMAQTSDDKFVSSWTATIRSQIGVSEEILKADYGDTVIEDAVRSSVSSNNLGAKIAFMLDSSESKRRIEEYDATTSWGGYIGTKTLSAVGNYMAVDPITTATTIASLGTGTLLPAAARSTFIASRLPWLSTPLNTAKTWWTAHATGLARANFGFNAIDGALSGYAFAAGYNQDQSILRGTNAVLDTNYLDDIALGGAIGLAGGWMGYWMNMRQISRNAAIESLAQSMGTVPHEFAVDYATRYVLQHGELIRAVRRIGADPTSDIVRKIQDPQFLRNAGFRSPEEIGVLRSLVESGKPTVKELADIIDSKLINETNDTVDFYNFVRGAFGEIRKKVGNRIATKTPEGRVIFDFESNKADILDIVRKGNKTDVGTNGRLKNLGYSDDDIKYLYEFVESRSGLTEIDFHEWVWSRTSDNLGLKQDIDIMLKFARNVEADELKVIQKHFPSAVPEPNESGIRFLSQRHGAGRTVEGVLAEISTGQKRSFRDIKINKYGDPEIGITEIPNHILADEVSINAERLSSGVGAELTPTTITLSRFLIDNKAKLDAIETAIENRVNALLSLPDKADALLNSGGVTQVVENFARIKSVFKQVTDTFKTLEADLRELPTLADQTKYLEKVKSQIIEIQEDLQGWSYLFENPGKLDGLKPQVRQRLQSRVKSKVQKLRERRREARQLSREIFQEWEFPTVSDRIKDKWSTFVNDIRDKFEDLKFEGRLLDIKVQQKVREILFGEKLEQAASDIHAVNINSKVVELFDNFAAKMTRYVDLRKQMVFTKEYNRLNGIVSLDTIVKNADNPKFAKSVQDIVSKVEKFKEKLTASGAFESNYHSQGMDLSAGHPGQRIEAFINSTDDDLIVAYNRLLKDIDAFKKQVGDEAFNPVFIERLGLLQKQRLLKNDLLRVRLKNGMLGEQLGLLNTTSTAFNAKPRLIDGEIPFRSRNNIGSPDSPVLLTKDKSMKEIDFDQIDDSVSEEELMAMMEKREVQETITFADKQAAQAEAVNTRFTDRLQYVVDLKKKNNPFQGTKYQKTFINHDNAYHDWTSAKDVLGEITTLQIRTGNPIVNLNDLLIHMNAELEVAADNLTFSIVLRDNKDIRFQNLPISILDETNFDIKTEALAEWVGKSKSLFDDADKEMKKLLQSGQLTRQQYNNIMSSYGIGNRVIGGWSFAAANAAVVGLRQATLGRYFGGEGLVKLAEWALTKSMDVQGSTASRLWFNKDFRARYGGMNAFEQVLVFANLIDSPHVLKRDFGNIIDLNLFSAQQLRNNNARKANAFIQVYKDLHSRGGITAEDNLAVINSLVATPGSAINLTPRQMQLRTAFEEYIRSYRTDVESIVGPNTAIRTMVNVLDNMYEDGVIQFNRSAVLANRSRIRTVIGNTLERYAQENIDILRNQGHPFWSGQGVLGTLNTRIANAATPTDLLALLTLPTGNRHTFGIERAIRGLSNAEVAAITNVDELVDAMNRVRTTPNNNFARGIQEQIEEYLEAMDRTRLYEISRQGRHNITAERFAGIRFDPNFRDLYRSVMLEPEMNVFRVNNLADIVVEHANNTGLGLAMQGQISREIGDVNIFQILEASRTHLRDVAIQAERSGLANQVKRTEETINALEDRMAHALGFQLEANPRAGWTEAGFRLQNGMIRASVGSFWGLQTAIAEVPKSILLNANRNGTINAIIDLVRAITTKEDLDDVGFALEQYTQRYALGIDNEAYQGRVQLNRATPQIGPIPSAVTGVNLNPANLMQRNADLLRGRIVDPNGVTSTIASTETPANALTTVLGRVTDVAVTTTESLANTNSRIGGQQWFLSVGRDMAVRRGKRQVVNNINRLLAFSREFATSNFDQIADFGQRLDAFKRLAKKHNLDWDFVVRMNHHGLLDEGDLLLLQQAFRNRSVVRPTRTLAGVQIGTGAREPYVLQPLLNELDSIAARTNTVSRRDDIAAKLTGFLDEEVNTAMNQASTIASNPNANIVQRWLFQFSNYARGFQHQTILRGANDSTIAKAVAMLVPIIIGEIIYTNVRRMMEGQARGQKTMEQAKSEFEAKLRENPELVIYETMSKVPVFGGLQSFMFNSAINPLQQETAIGRDIRDKWISGAHNWIYDGTDWAVGNINKMTGENYKTDDFVSPTPNQQNIYLPTNYPWDFRPYSDGVKFVNELVTDNPYRNEAKVYWDFPTGRVYSMVPGVRTWQFQTALRNLGYPALRDDARAKEFNKR